MNKVSCLFCASPCSPDAVINLQEVTSSSLVFPEDGPIEEHLRAVFVLSRILKISQDLMCQFLTKGDGQFYPELWFNVCGECGECVADFHETLKQVSKLEKKLTQLESELKGKIERSISVSNNDAIWNHIRREALKGK